MSSSFSSSPSSTMCPIGGPAGMALGPVLSRTFFGSFVDLEARPNRHSLLDLMFDPAGCAIPSTSATSETSVTMWSRCEAC
jgi:hypothetical protein